MSKITEAFVCFVCGLVTGTAVTAGDVNGGSCEFKLFQFEAMRPIMIPLLEYTDSSIT